MIKIQKYLPYWFIAFLIRKGIMIPQDMIFGHQIVVSSLTLDKNQDAKQEALTVLLTKMFETIVQKYQDIRVLPLIREIEIAEKYQADTGNYVISYRMIARYNPNGFTFLYTRSLLDTLMEYYKVI